MEENITLTELLELYDSAMQRGFRLAKIMAMAMGADVDLAEDDDGSKSSKPAAMPVGAIDPRKGGQATPIFSERETKGLPIGLGYSKISKE